VLIGLMPVSGLVTSVALGAQEFTLVSAVGATTVALGCAIALWKGTQQPVDHETHEPQAPTTTAICATTANELRSTS